MRKALDRAFLSATAETAALFQIASASSGIPAAWLLDHSTTNRRNAFEGIANTPESEIGVNHDTYLGKAIRDSRESNIWLPMESPYLADLVEALTHQGQTHIQSLSSALKAWLHLKNNPQNKPGTNQTRPLVPVSWTADELDAWKTYFLTKPQATWEPQDWSMMVEWLMQQYWSPQWAGTMGQWVAVKSTLLGQIEAALSAAPLLPKQAAALAAAMPASVDAVVSLGLPVDAVVRSLVSFGQARCAQAIVDMGDRLKASIKAEVLTHQQAVLLGEKPTGLENRLFEKFATANRDWRRIAVTEVGENAAQGAIASCKPGDQVRRVERYKGVCAWCAKINGRVLTVVDPGKPNKNGETEVWPGKTNLGRSSAPKKRVDGKLFDREPDELWWIAAGAQHPHCRGRWLPLNGVKPQALDKFLAKVQARMAQYQAEAAAASSS